MKSSRATIALAALAIGYATVVNGLSSLGLSSDQSWLVSHRDGSGGGKCCTCVGPGQGPSMTPSALSQLATKYSKSDL
jgi:hypothetical protein